MPFALRGGHIGEKRRISTARRVDPVTFWVVAIYLKWRFAMRRMISRRILIPISVRETGMAKMRPSNAADYAEIVIERKRQPALQGEMWVVDGLLTVTSSDGRQKTKQVGKCTAGWIGAAHAPGIGGRTRGRSK